MFDIYKNKKVLVTGHTGFKGSWLVAWLKLLGANVVGIANNQTSPSLYQSTGLANLINDIHQDICDLEALKKILENEKPDFVFHLAAQALVRESYIDPITTWKTNLVGTVNILESLRVLKKKCTAILITSDKCYDNVEWVWGYREHDRLGGPDPYSASKGAAELAINSYKKSFFNDDSSITICSARAGNVIGGGDWSKDRIIPDCVRAWANKEKVILRNPGSTRPWQHVLEPLSGYLLLGSLADNDKKLNGHSFNFGPNTNEDLSVLNVVKEMSNYWDDVSWDINKDQAEFYESGLLKLNCDKARSMLGWEAILDLQDTIRLTANWYKSFYEDEDMSIVTSKQINEFTELSNIKNQRINE